MFVTDSVDPLGDLAALPGAHLLIRDSLACPGAWLLPWVIKHYGAQGCKVVVLAAAYSERQYRAALRKLGPATAPPAAAPGAQAGTDSSPISFLCVSDAAAGSDTGVADPGGAGRGAGGGAAAAGPELLHRLVARLAEALAPLQGQAVALVVDDLQQVACLAGLGPPELRPGQHPQGPGAQAWLAFLGSCGAAAGGRLAWLAHGDVAGDAWWLRHLAHSADVVLDLEPVEGRTAELDGRLTLERRRAAAAAAGAPSSPASGGGAASGAVPPVGRSARYFFRCGEYAVKWLPQMNAHDVL